jgi:FkbM family methyltransferase
MNVRDCGAYIGDSIRQFLSNFQKLRRITAFEPDKRTCEKCKVTVNGLKRDGLRIDVMNIAVSNRSGAVAFEVSDSPVGSRMDGSLRSNAENRKTEAQSHKIDECLP